MDGLIFIGRILFSLVFIGSGIGHLTQTEGSAQYAAYKKVPSPKLAVLASGVVFLLGGLSVLLGVVGDLGALVLALALVPTTFMMHRFWEEKDPQAKQTEMAGFMKNLALIGGALILMGVMGKARQLGYTITDGVFDF